MRAHAYTDPFENLSQVRKYVKNQRPGLNHLEEKLKEVNVHSKSQSPLQFVINHHILAYPHSDTLMT